MGGHDKREDVSIVTDALNSASSGNFREKSVFTTGEVADICQISQQTVIRCFDSGKLKGFRVPGSKFRRIPRESLVLFMTENQIPLANLETGKKRVLIVDDDPEIVDVLVEILEADGRFEVMSASNGFDAGAASKSFKPDMVLLDFMLPDINGNIVCERIKQDADLSKTRVIIVSGAVDPSEVETLLAAGADDFIQKPFDIQHLISRMVELLAA